MTIIIKSFSAVADLIPDSSKVSFGQLKQYLRELIEVELPDETEKKIAREVMVLVGAHTNYFEAPASARFHLNEPQGLLRHSLGVTYRLLALMSAYNITDKYNKLDVILAGLLHDLGKASQVWLSPLESDKATKIGNETYAIDSSDYYIKEYLKTRPAEYKYSINHELTAMSVPMRSLYFISTVLSDLWKPTPDAYQAVMFHDSMYVPEGKYVAHSDCKLTVCLANSDYFQSRCESGWKNV